MKLTLKDFQAEAVDRLRNFAAFARTAVEVQGPQTLVLSAPTGSGKTAMAAAWMERVRDGDEEHAPEPDATFLWLTDQPELNEQTRRKLHDSSSTFAAYQLVTIDAAFHAETFAPGCIYFLNTQKLSRTANLVRRGDHRTFTLWDTITNTARQHPGSFWVVIDEAHRGMSEGASSDSVRTIAQKFIKGSEGEVPPMPLILGISATPDRFTKLLAGTTKRTTSPVADVDAETVRASGLLKEAITLHHPEETQPSDWTLLRAAAEQSKRYAAEWAAYAAKELAPAVHPVLVVQVEDASANKLTKTDLAECLATVEDALGPLDDAAVAHSFQEGGPVDAGNGRALRYVAPSDIQDDTSLKVVFFKRSLTTGWDCPRAEVMMSFRKAADRTLIAQLVGRMVRTPLARSVAESEFLNSVCLYLPHYDTESLDAVIKDLSDPDPEVGFPTRVQKGEDLVTLSRNPAAAAAFEAAANLITYRVDKVIKQSNIRRLLRLGRLLAWDKLDTDAPSSFTAALVAELTTERLKVESSQEFAERLADAASIDVRAVTVAYGSTEPLSVTSTQLAAVPGNVEHAFAEAGRKLGGGLHASYLSFRAGEGQAPPVAAIKLELYALLQDPTVAKVVDDRAGKLLAQHLEQHKAAVMRLPEQRRQMYRLIRRQATKPAPEPWELPQSIEGSKAGNVTLERHLYVTETGDFTCKLNGLEEEVMTGALAETGVIGWLRNDPRKPWSFAVPYQVGNEFKPMYPDFLVFRQQGSGIVCDILEPHALAFGDSADKARGLAQFARDHGDGFGRIRFMAQTSGGLQVLKLEELDVRDKVAAVSNLDHLKLLLADS